MSDTPHRKLSMSYLLTHLLPDSRPYLLTHLLTDSLSRSSLFRSGQAIVEYAVLIGIAAAALVVMQTYIKRGVQAGIKVAADQIGDQRQGLVEPDRNRIWIVREESQVTTNTPPSTRSVERRVDGVTVYRSAQVASGSGRQSFSLSAERNQQEQ